MKTLYIKLITNLFKPGTATGVKGNWGGNKNRYFAPPKRPE
jgi:hypothetical protein